MYATGVGSLPGKDFAGAVRHVLGSFEHAWLPELPARGVGADMIGRTTAMLEGLAVDLQPQGWRLGVASGVDHGRARGLLRSDLDALEEFAQAFTGRVTLTAAGPVTLAACLERPRGDKVLADHGARRELADSLGAGITALLSELRRRLPQVDFDLQLDEPMLPAVMAGRVATASGFSRLRSLDRPQVADLLGRTLTPAREPADSVAVHCCAPGLDVDLMGRVDVDLLVLDAGVLRPSDLDLLGPWLEQGRGVRLGVAPTAVPDAVSAPDQLVRRALEVLRPLGLDPELVVERVSLTTACGLAGWSAGAAARQLDHLVRAAELLPEQLLR